MIFGSITHKHFLQQSSREKSARDMVNGLGWYVRLVTGWAGVNHAGQWLVGKWVIMIQDLGSGFVCGLSHL